MIELITQKLKDYNFDDIHLILIIYRAVIKMLESCYDVMMTFFSISFIVSTEKMFKWYDVAHDERIYK